MQQQAAAVQEQTLTAANPDQIKQQISLELDQSVKTDTDPQLDKQASEFVGSLLSLNLQNVQATDNVKSAVEGMGLDLQKKSASHSKMLQGPVKNLANRSEDGGTVANALVDLKMQVEDLDPGKIDLEAGWFSRVVGSLPGIGTPLKRYFSKYESAQTVIDAIIRSLEQGKEQLKRDNVTLAEDQKRMRELTIKLKKAVALGQLIDQKIEYSLQRELANDPEKQKFVQEELLFPLRQRIVDLQQQLAVNQQGVLSVELIIRNNQELIRGVNRALTVTVSALEVAVTVAMALADQRIVLDKINALSQTTNTLIAGTAARLRTQGAEIHKQAASTKLDMATLTQAFADIKAAMDDIANFRVAALPQMAQAILDMDKLTGDAEKKIAQMEQSNAKKGTIQLTIE